MKKFLLAAAVLLSMATVASAAPLKLSDQQLDQTTAGSHHGTTVIVSVTNGSGNGNGNGNSSKGGLSIASGNLNGNLNGSLILINLGSPAP